MQDICPLLRSGLQLEADMNPQADSQTHGGSLSMQGIKMKSTSDREGPSFLCLAECGIYELYILALLERKWMNEKRTKALLFGAKPCLPSRVF